MKYLGITVLWASSLALTAWYVHQEPAAQYRKGHADGHERGMQRAARLSEDAFEYGYLACSRRDSRLWHNYKEWKRDRWLWIAYRDGTFYGITTEGGE